MATVLLGVLGVALVVPGRRIPLKPFFTVTSLLIFYLGFKLIGDGPYVVAT